MSKTFIFVILAIVLGVLIGSGQARSVSTESSDPTIVCRLPAMKGHCRALLPRWRYDPATGKCVEFAFGGCDGNGNNFRTQKDCATFCAGI